MTEPIRVLVVDDEPLALRTLQRLVARDLDCQIVGACRSSEEAIAAIRRDSPDLVLLDIQMAGGTGFDVVNTIGPAAMPTVIFITAHATHTLEAFEAEAIDYVLKPFTDERFARTMVRAKARVVERRITARDSGRPATGTTGRFIVRSGDRIVFVRPQDIDWIEAEDYYARLHVARARHLVRMTLTGLEQSLDPAQFMRVHRSAIVNLDRVRELRVRSTGEYAVVLRSGTELPVSRARRDALSEVLRRRQ